jgi:ubiquitin carboxyl-terminal hydrolase 34
LSRPAEESDRHPDHVVIGYMSLLTALLKERPEFKEKIGSKNSPVQLVSHLFTKCLFFDSSRADSADKTRLVIKFKSAESRNAAYTLLLELANNCMINTFEICLLVLAHQGIIKKGNFNITRTNMDPGDTKSYTPPAEVPRKSYTGYVGLKNLGATCYMNSVMQQFFMMPELRRGFFEASTEVKSLANQEDKALVREIGRMFGWLQESDRQYYDPLSFTKSFKVHGEDVNLLTQQDADEFFNLLCDQLERVLQDTKQAKLLHDTFAGSLHQTLVCKVDPSHRSSRAEQDFFTLSLEIQNKNNLDQALDSFFQGEAIQDFHCEKCNKKVEITKRFSLDRPANTMIIHLKRFKFDLFTMQKEKLYDYFQFPMRVNMKKYTRAVIDDGQDASTVPDEPYEYQLSGVVVHSGSAEMGHYYSFIKVRSICITITVADAVLGTS